MASLPAFFDSNVILYLLSGDAHRAERAEALLSQGGVVSVQVLNEMAAVSRGKLGLGWDEIHEILGTVRAVCQVVPVTVDIHQSALDLARRHGFPVYDALIVGAALAHGCPVLYTEDLQHGQRIGGRLRLVNPFR